MQRTLYDLTAEAQEGSQEGVMSIIEKFSPLIKKYSRRLNYDGADSDLTIALIEIVKAIPITKNSNLKKEEQIIGYISTSIKNKYISLSKKYGNIYSKELSADFEEGQSIESGLEEKIFVKELLDELTTLQKEVISKRYLKNMSNIEIAEELNISRQAVNRIKCRALKRMRDYAIFCDTG